MSRGVLLGAVAVRFAALTETRGQKARTQVLDVGQTGGQLLAAISGGLPGKSHGSLLSDRHYKLSDTETKPQPNLIKLRSEFSCRAPSDGTFVVSMAGEAYD